MRIYLLSLVVTFLVFYAWKDWYKALCGLIILMAFIERPDMPKSIMGIPGMNPWNILFASILFAFLAARKREGLVWDMPANIKRYLYFYVFVIVLAFVREFIDISGLIDFAKVMRLEPATRKDLFMDDLINTFKYAVPGILLYLGCKDEERLKLAYGAVLLLNVLLALQIIRWMPLSEITDGEALKDRASRVLDREIGYYRTDLAIMLAGASWAFYTYRELLTSKLLSNMALVGSLITALGMALTGGRIGMAAWGFVAFILAVFRWRKFLILAPVAVLLLGLAIPSVLERMTQGFTEDTVEKRSEELMGDNTSSGGVDLYTVTAGRAAIWPYVIERIGEAPFFGYGRRAMKRIGLSSFLMITFNEGFPHPHNAYLQLLLDNGWILALPVFIFYLVILLYSLRLLRDRSMHVYVAIGGGTLAFVIGQLVGSTGSQSFYPAAGAVSMWCFMGLMLRVYVQRKQLIESKDDKSGDDTERDLWRKAERVER